MNVKQAHMIEKATLQDHKHTLFSTSCFSTCCSPIAHRRNTIERLYPEASGRRQDAVLSDADAQRVVRDLDALRQQARAGAAGAAPGQQGDACVPLALRPFMTLLTLCRRLRRSALTN